MKPVIVLDDVDIKNLVAAHVVAIHPGWVVAGIEIEICPAYTDPDKPQRHEIEKVVVTMKPETI